MLGALIAAALQTAPPSASAPPSGPDHAFVLTGTGRFAVLADLASIRRDGDTAAMRSFQVVEPGFSAAGDAYWGGWSRWAFDCKALTADRLDFASVREGGAEGPSTPEPQPPYTAAPGGDAAELLAVACGDGGRTSDLTTIEAAVARGRASLASSH